MVYTRKRMCIKLYYPESCQEFPFAKKWAIRLYLKITIFQCEVMINHYSHYILDEFGFTLFRKTHWCSHRVEDFACVEINAGEVLHRQHSPVVVSKPLALLRRSQRSRGLNINQPVANKVWVYMGLLNGHSSPSTFFQWRILIINYINSWGNLLWGVLAGSPLNLGLLLSNNWRNTIY